MCMVGLFALAGGIISTMGAVRQAEEEQAVAEFYAAQEAENARLARREAENIKIMGEQEQADLRNKMLVNRSQARSQIAANGVVLGEGSVLDYEADIADAYDLDARNLEYDIESRSWQKKVAASNSAGQSMQYSLQAAAAERKKTTSLWSGIFNTGAATAQGLYTDATFVKEAVGVL